MMAEGARRQLKLSNQQTSLAKVLHLATSRSGSSDALQKQQKSIARPFKGQHQANSGRGGASVFGTGTRGRQTPRIPRAKS